MLQTSQFPKQSKTNIRRKKTLEKLPVPSQKMNECPWKGTILKGNQSSSKHCTPQTNISSKNHWLEEVTFHFTWSILGEFLHFQGTGVIFSSHQVVERMNPQKRRFRGILGPCGWITTPFFQNVRKSNSIISLGVKIKNGWNHHLASYCWWFRDHASHITCMKLCS